MKRTITITVALVVFLGALVCGVLYLNNPNYFSEMFSPQESETVETTTIQYERIPVCSGKIRHTYSATGAVISQAPDLYINEIVLDYVSDTNFQLVKEKGDRILPSDVVYVYRNVEKSVDFTGQMIDCKFVTEGYNRKAVIRLLNFDKLYITTKVSADKIEKLSYDTKVEVQIGEESYPSKITDIGYEISDKVVPVCLEMPTIMLPGTEVKVTFILDVQKSGLYVPKEAVFQDGEASFVKVLVSDDIEQRKITVGQFFSMEEDGTIID